MKEKIKGYFDLIRPFTLIIPIFVSSSIMLASFVYNKGTWIDLNTFLYLIIPASISLAILNGASNALNQITDIETDKISKPKRPLPRGILSVKEALIASISMYVTAILISVFINQTFFTINLLIAIFSITYSIPPRIKDKLLLNQIWIGIARGLFGILASWSLFGNIFDLLPFTIGLMAMCFLIGGSVTKDISDSYADRKTGASTLINTYGVKKTSLIVFPFMFFPFFFIPMLIDAGFLNSNLLPLTFLSISSFFICYLIYTNDKKIRKIENTLSWIIMYLTYSFFAIGFSFLTITSNLT